MVILARASITMTKVIDISSVTWYYKLQASTASPPAKPTTDTPSGWSTTEPTYTEGSTNSLYVCQKTTFSDGTFAYSDVSLSSSYEAAKTAYNKSVAAQQAATEMGVEYIEGTQTAKTGSWTGVTTATSLTTGKTIAYKLPYAGSGNATLNLTLADGTATGAIAVYTGTTRVTTHFGAGSVIKMTYDGQYWRADSIPNTNNVDRTQYGVALAASEAIAADRIAVLGTDGKLRLLDDTTAFDMSCPPLYVGTAYSAANVTAAATRVTNYSYWGTAFNLTNTHAVAGAAAGKAVYIVGTLSGTTFTPNSTVLTCTVPTSADGLYYMRLGMMSTAANAVLEATHPVYIYYNGKFQTIEEAAKAEAASALTAANGKNKHYYLPSTSPPVGASSGDQWFKTDKGMELYRYDGSAWQKVGLLTSVFSTVEAGGATIGQIDSMLLHFDEDNYWNLSSADFDENLDPTSVEADVVYKAHTLKTSHLIATEDVQVIGGSGSIIKIPTKSASSSTQESYAAFQNGGLTTVSDYTDAAGVKITAQYVSDVIPGADTMLVMKGIVNVTDYAMYAQTGFDLCDSFSIETNGFLFFKSSGATGAKYMHEGITYHGYDQTSRSNANVHNFKIDPVNKAIQIGGNSTTDWTMSINGYDLSNLASGSYPTQAHMRGACAVYTYDNDTCRYMAFAVNPTSKRLFVYGSNDPTALSYIGRVDLV